MAMAMGSLGVPAISLNAFQVAMHTSSSYGNARFKRIDSDRIRHELDNKKIVIVTGFQGVNKYDDITTLGRGGSDTTAVALAAALHADACEILYRRRRCLHSRPKSCAKCKENERDHIRRDVRTCNPRSKSIA